MISNNPLLNGRHFYDLNVHSSAVEYFLAYFLRSWVFFSIFPFIFELFKAVFWSTMARETTLHRWKRTPFCLILHSFLGLGKWNDVTALGIKQNLVGEVRNQTFNLISRYKLTVEQIRMEWVIEWIFGPFLQLIAWLRYTWPKKNFNKPLTMTIEGEKNFLTLTLSHFIMQQIGKIAKKH